MVKTSPFHGGITGSNPVGVIMLKRYYSYNAYIILEDYPSPAEGNGLENRQTCKSVQEFESLILLNLHNIIAEWRSWHLVGLITRRS